MAQYAWQWQVIVQNQEIFYRGIYTTLILSCQATALGLVVSLIFLAGLKSSYNPLKWLIQAILEVLRDIPVLVLLIWIYYVLPILVGLKLDAWSACLVAFSFNISGFLTESFRAAVESISIRQYYSGLVHGLNKAQIWWYILLPQLYRRILPDLLNYLILVIKGTSLASVIAVPDLLYNSNLLISNSFRPLEIYTVLALVYCLMIIPMSLSTKWLERRLNTVNQI